MIFLDWLNMAITSQVQKFKEESKLKLIILFLP